MPVILPIPLEAGESAVSAIFTLEGVRFEMEFQWFERCCGWSLNIREPDTGTLLLAGRRLVLHSDILGPYRNTFPSLPQGALKVYSLDPDDVSDPRFEDLVPGGRCRLVYFSEEERETLLEAS